MEIKYQKYVWWGNGTEKLHGTLKRIEPQTDKDGNPKTTKDGRSKHLLIIETLEYGEVWVTIVESQRKFWDYQIGKTGTITHDNGNNFLSFTEEEDIVDVWDKPEQGAQPFSDEEIAMMFGQTPVNEERERYFDKQQPHMVRGWLKSKIERMENDLEWYKQILEELEDGSE